MDAKWFKIWKKYVEYEISRIHHFSTFEEPSPGQIDNRGLLKNGNPLEMVGNLMDVYEFQIVPEEAWKWFQSWYGGKLYFRGIFYGEFVFFQV